MLDKNKDLKLYYSIKEVADMFQVNESLLRYWEKEFPQLNPQKAGRGIRQYTKDDIEQIKLIHHLVKERGMTLEGARQRLAKNKGTTGKQVEVLEKLKDVRERLVAMRDALDGFTYQQVDDLKNNLAASTRESQT